MDQASRLLVIGDDPQWLHTLTTTLASAGYEVSGAPAGSEGLEQTAEQKPDLVLLGIPSSGRDDFQRARYLQDRAGHPSCLLLLFDASPTAARLTQALEAGADDWLVWPASERELVARVQTTLCRQRLTQARQENEERRLYARLEQHSRTLEDQVTARTHEIEQRRQVAESLRDMLTILNSDLPLDEVLSYIVAGATRLLGSDTSAIYRLESPHAPMSIQTIQGSAAEAVGEVEFPPQFHQVLHQGQPIAVTDVAAMPADSPLALAMGCVPDCFRALLVVPLSAQGELYGGLALYYAQPRNLSDEEMGLAMAFAAQAALAIQNARLRQQVREAAVMEERARLARELHDSVTQALFSMTLLAEAGQRLLKSGDAARLEVYLRRLGEMSHQSLKEMRLLVYELRPPVLEQHGLLGALQQRIDAVEARSGVDARLLVEGMGTIPQVVEENLYRIAQQALNNALKHAAATSLTIRIRAGDDHLVLEITDDGRGFDPKAAGDGAGQGLVSMRERAAQIGGTLAIISAPGCGTTISVRVPTTASPENHEVKR